MYFKGLPIPAAATFIASLILFTTEIGGLRESRHMVLIVVMYALSFLMVSTIRYLSFKELDLKRQKPFHVLVAMILVFIVIAYKPKIMLFFMLGAYIASGPVIYLRRFRKGRLSAEGEPEAIGLETTGDIRGADEGGVPR
jgi:CDP-diacylglycerol--serine O-phosphatidyltransferase